MAVLKNRAKMSTSTTGTGTITLGSAESGYQTFGDAGVANADVVRYVIEDSGAWEIGTGTYTASGTTLTRTVSESSNSGSAIVLTGSATVFIGATAEDIYTDANVDTHLNTSTATTGEVLSWSGTDYDWIAAGGGGGGADLYAANESSPSAQPSATGVNAVAIGDSAIAAGIRSITAGKGYSSGTDSFAAAITDNTSAYGSTGTSSIALGYTAEASSSYSAALGGNAVRANASYSTAVGGSDNYVSGTRSITAGGQGNAVTGTYASVIGGRFNRAPGEYSSSSGYFANAGTYGKEARANGNFGGLSTIGDSQRGLVVLRSDTTDATAEVLTANNSTASADNQVILPNNSAYFFSGTIIAREQASAGTDVGAWEIKGAIRREANPASTVLVKSTIDDFNVPTGWAVALTADTTNGGLAITVTGAASTNIRWVATVNTSEVTY